VEDEDQPGMTSSSEVELRKSLEWLALSEKKKKHKKRKLQESEKEPQKQLIRHTTTTFNPHHHMLNVQFNAFHYITTFKERYWVYAPIFTKVFEQGIPLIKGKELHTLTGNDAVFAISVILPLAQGAMLCGNPESCKYLLDMVDNFLKSESLPETYPLADALHLKAAIMLQFEGPTERVRRVIEWAMKICRDNQWRNSDVYHRCMCLTTSVGGSSGKELVALNEEFGEVGTLPYCSYYVDQQVTATMPVSLPDLRDIATVAMIQFHVDLVYALYKSTRKDIHRERLEDTIKILESLEKKLRARTWCAHVRYTMLVHLIAVLSLGYFQLGKLSECKESLKRFIATLCVINAENVEVYSAPPFPTTLRLFSKICFETNNIDILYTCYSLVKKGAPHLPFLQKMVTEFKLLLPRQDFVINKKAEPATGCFPVPEPLSHLPERTKRKRTVPPKGMSAPSLTIHRHGSFPPTEKRKEKTTTTDSTRPKTRNFKFHSSHLSLSTRPRSSSAGACNSTKPKTGQSSLRWHEVNPSLSVDSFFNRTLTAQLDCGNTKEKKKLNTDNNTNNNRDYYNNNNKKENFNYQSSFPRSPGQTASPAFVDSSPNTHILLDDFQTSLFHGQQPTRMSDPMDEEDEMEYNPNPQTTRQFQHFQHQPQLQPQLQQQTTQPYQQQPQQQRYQHQIQQQQTTLPYQQQPQQQQTTQPYERYQQQPQLQPQTTQPHQQQTAQPYERYQQQPQLQPQTTQPHQQQTAQPHERYQQQPQLQPQTTQPHQQQTAQPYERYQQQPQLQPQTTQPHQQQTAQPHERYQQQPQLQLQQQTTQPHQQQQTTAPYQEEPQKEPQEESETGEMEITGEKEMGDEQVSWLPSDEGAGDKEILDLLVGDYGGVPGGSFSWMNDLVEDGFPLYFEDHLL